MDLHHQSIHLTVGPTEDVAANLAGDHLIVDWGSQLVDITIEGPPEHVVAFFQNALSDCLEQVCRQHGMLERVAGARRGDGVTVLTDGPIAEVGG